MKVLGFPIHVRPGFLFFMVLIVALYRNEFGVWLAGSIAVFTVLHELGHAVAARRAGATAEISLDFLAGYASYSSKEPLSRRTEAGIALGRAADPHHRRRRRPAGAGCQPAGRDRSAARPPPRPPSGGPASPSAPST